MGTSLIRRIRTLFREQGTILVDVVVWRSQWRLRGDGEHRLERPIAPNIETFRSEDCEVPSGEELHPLHVCGDDVGTVMHECPGEV